MTNLNYKRTRRACFTAYPTMASAFVLPPMLFVTFNESFNISFTLLGSLVLINFFTQMVIDLIFTFLAKSFNVKATAVITPLLTSLGFIVYAVSPWVFKDNVFIGLVLGTVLFALAGGLCEVLISPIIAACQSDTPERDMSILHSLYGWGVVGAVIVSALFFLIFSTAKWQYLVFFFATLPLVTSVMFMFSPMPEMKDESVQPTEKGKKGKGLLLCSMCIFLGACAENTMTNWISSFTEIALGIPKTVGDVLGLAVFAFLLALTRVLYAKFTPDITKTLLVGMIGSAVCYLVVGFVHNTVVCLIASILVGLFASMLWPGTLILMEEKIPSVGVAAYALMAACGDMGSSVAPQLLGVIVDNVSVSGFALELGASLGVTATEIAMKLGMLVTAIFPIIGAVVVVCMMKAFKPKQEKKMLND